MLCTEHEWLASQLALVVAPFHLANSMSDDSAAETNAAVYLVYWFAMFHQSFSLPSLRNYYTCFSKLSGILCSLVSIYGTWEKFGAGKIWQIEHHSPMFYPPITSQL